MEPGPTSARPEAGSKSGRDHKLLYICANWSHTATCSLIALRRYGTLPPLSGKP